MRRYVPSGNEVFDTVLSSVEELDKKKSLIDRQRIAQIEELVLAAVFAEKDPDRAFSAIAGLKPRESLNVENVIERIALCKKFLSIYGSKWMYERYFGTIESDQEKTRRVGILENQYGEFVFKRFCKKAELLPMHFQSFDEICESIAGGACECGIIPTESSDNGKLLRFYSLIDRYDLKINAVCDAEYSDSSATTRYALVSQILEYPGKRFGSHDYLELSVNLETPQLLNHIIYAASLCSMALHRVDSRPIPYKEREFLFCPVFDVRKADIDTFLLYMFLDFPRYTPIGIFSKI